MGMSPSTTISLIGGLAAVCTTGAFIPQLVRTWRQGARDLSYGMLGVYLVGVALWLGYGLLTGARAVILANAATGVLVAANIVLKFRAERPRHQLRRGTPADPDRASHPVAASAPPA
jgi:MtN3 and saliva related transmembrane protein